MRDYLTKVFFLLGKDRKKLPFLLFLFVVSSSLDMIGIGLMGPFFGIFFGAEVENSFFDSNIALLADVFNLNLLEFLTCVILAVFSVKTLLSVLIARYVIMFGQSQQVKLRKALISSFQTQSYLKLIEQNSSSYLNAMQTMVVNFANLIMYSLQSVGEIIVSMMLLVLLFFVNPQVLILLLSVCAISMLFFDLTVRRKMLLAGKISNTSSADLIKNIRETLKGFRDIKIMEGEEFFSKRVVSSATKFADAQASVNFFSMLPRYLFEFIILAFVLSFVLIFRSNQLEPTSFLPTLAIFGFAAIRIMPLARNISFTLNRIRFAKDSVYELSRLMSKEAGKTNVRREKDRKDLSSFCALELKNLSFNYPHSSNLALQDVNLKIFAGEHIGIIGSSGAGKTTLVNTILGLIRPKRGKVFLDNVDVTERPDLLWQIAAYLPQEIFLIDASLEENVALAVDDGKIDERRLRAALTFSQLDDVVAALKFGAKTQIGENGMSLSGGQRQRIALARAFYFDKKILILDEATSALDIETETQITTYLKELKREITVISISHRQSSLTHCDKIFELAQGKLNLIDRNS